MKRLDIILFSQKLKSEGAGRVQEIGLRESTKISFEFEIHSLLSIEL